MNSNKELWKYEIIYFTVQVYTPKWHLHEKSVYLCATLQALTMFVKRVQFFLFQHNYKDLGYRAT